MLFDVFVLAHAVRDLLAAGMAKSPLTPEEYAIYSHLLECGPCTPTELARDLRAPATTVSDWVRTMTRRRHARQVPVATDRRSYALTLTPAGRRAHTSANRWFEEINAQFLAALPREESELRRYLAEILAATRQNESRRT